MNLTKKNCIIILVTLIIIYFILSVFLDLKKEETNKNIMINSCNNVADLYFTGTKGMENFCEKVYEEYINNKNMLEEYENEIEIGY